MPSLVLSPNIPSALPCQQHSKSPLTAMKWLQTVTLATKTSQASACAGCCQYFWIMILGQVVCTCTVADGSEPEERYHSADV